MWKFVPWTGVFKFIERVGVPSAMAAAMMYIIFIGLGRLEKKIDAHIAQSMVDAAMMKNYRDLTEERIILIRGRRHDR